MATRKQIKELNEELAKLEKKYASLNRTSPFKGKDAKELAKAYGSVAAATKEVETSMKGINAEILEMESGLDGLKSIFADIGKELGGYDDPLKAATKSFKKIRGFAEDLSDIQYDLTKSTTKETKALQTKVNLEFNRLKRQKQSLENQLKSDKLTDAERDKIVELLQLAIDKEKVLEDQVGYQDQFNKALDETLRRQKNISKATGLSGKLIKGLGGLAEKIGFGDMSEDLDRISMQMKDHGAALTDNGDKAATLGMQFRVMGTGLKGLGKSLMDALSDPLVIIGLVVKAVKELFSIFNHVLKVTSDVGQTFGVAGHQAHLLKKEIHAAGDASRDIYYFTEELLGAQRQLNDAAGLNLKFNEENAKMFQDMTLYAGMSADQVARIATLSYEAGVPLAEMSQSVTDSFNSANDASGVYLNQRQIFEQLANASGSVRFNIKGGTDGLVRAAHTAARLGTTMNEIAAASKSHLDFESSIAKEIEAEMFLQKDLNLDKLRHAVLTGDTVTIAEEQERLIRENADSLEGNVVAQESFAQLLGIGNDELSEQMLSLKKNKNLSADQLKVKQAEAKEQAALNKEAVAFDREMQSAVKQLKAALEPLAKEIGPVILSLVKKIGPMIESVVKFLKSDTGKILLGIAAGFMAIKAAVGIVGKVKSFFGKGFEVFGKRGSSPINPMWVEDATGSGGGGGGGGYGDYGSSGSRGNKGVTYDKKAKRYRNSKGQFVKKPKGFKPKTRFKGRGLLGLGLGLASMAGMNYLLSGDEDHDSFESGMTATAATGNTMMAGAGMDLGLMGVEAGADQMMGNRAMNSQAPPPPKPKPPKPTTTPKASKGFFGSALDFGKNMYSKAYGAVSGVGNKVGAAYDFVGSKASAGYDYAKGKVGSAYDATKGYVQNTSAFKGLKKGINTIGDFVNAGKGWMSKNIPAIFPKILKSVKGGLRGVLTKIPVLGAIIEAIFTGLDVNEIAQSKGVSKDEIYSQMGKSVISGGLGLTLGSLAAAGVSSLQGIGIPGWLLAGAAYMGGDYLGRLIGDSISDYVGGPFIGKSIYDLFYNNGEHKKNNITELAEGGILSRPTFVAGEAGAEAVIPLTEFYAKFDELVKAVKSGGNVYLDGNKVGHALALGEYKMGG